ncbi:unnamed protein product [Periconia digitata]|uniref:Uncharacterized protein n=1 Tax=Periconia digitata TaxID=1303443 RepID=A0A9W4UNL3_9PLEO|nr:unnamed protein product [Periconia digitata]
MCCLRATDSQAGNLSYHDCRQHIQQEHYSQLAKYGNISIGCRLGMKHQVQVLS